MPLVRDAVAGAELPDFSVLTTGLGKKRGKTRGNFRKLGMSKRQSASGKHGHNVKHTTRGNPPQNRRVLGGACSAEKQARKIQIQAEAKNAWLKGSNQFCTASGLTTANCSSSWSSATSKLDTPIQRTSPVAFMSSNARQLSRQVPLPGLRRKRPTHHMQFYVVSQRNGGSRQEEAHVAVWV